MKISLHKNEKTYTIDDVVFYLLTIGIHKQNNVNCYYLNHPKFTYFESPQFSGNLKKGGSVNCEKISYYPHASGTHTECALHITDVDFTMADIEIPLLQLCILISITPTNINNDFVLNETHFSELKNIENATAIIVRTLPNTDEKLNKNYSDTNPPYFTKEALTHLKSLGFQHILTDLPSIDKESDEGQLAAHKAWFLTNGIAEKNRTITEFIYIKNEIEDGQYLLNIQLPKMETDAVSSNIFLYPFD